MTSKWLSFLLQYDGPDGCCTQIILQSVSDTRQGPSHKYVSVLVAHSVAGADVTVFDGIMLFIGKDGLTRGTPVRGNVLQLRYRQCIGKDGLTRGTPICGNVQPLRYRQPAMLSSPLPPHCLFVSAVNSSLQNQTFLSKANSHRNNKLSKSHKMFLYVDGLQSEWSSQWGCTSCPVPEQRSGTRRRFAHNMQGQKTALITADVDRRAGQTALLLHTAGEMWQMFVRHNNDPIY
jgi:hypothetical protein